MRYATGGALAVLLATAAPAFAQAPPPPMTMAPVLTWGGWYAGANLGAGFSDNGVKFGGTGGTPAALASGQMPRSLDGNPSGVVGGLQLGYNFSLGPLLLGLETDFDYDGYNENQIVTRSPGAPLFTTTTQAQQRMNWFGTTRGRLGFTPSDSWLFFGTGGVAYADTHVNSSVGTSAADGSGGTPCIGFCGAGTTEGVKVGWTAGGGVEYRVSPAISVKAEYLYYDLGSASQAYADNLGRFAGTTVTTNTKFAGNIARIGVNYHFGAPSPPPPAPAAMPAPPPAAPRVFIVFFDWDKDTITPEGQAIIQQAADAYKSGAPVQLQVTGYTDRSGSPGYNQRLSERRANNVAKALAALGVPRAQMVVSGRGENDNRVPTADGVREPQNRRVEIVAP